MVGALACGDAGQVWHEDTTYSATGGWVDVSGGISSNYDFISVVAASEFFHALVRDAAGAIYYTATRTQGRHWTRPIRLPAFDGNSTVIRGSLAKGVETLYFNLSADLAASGEKVLIHRALRPQRLKD
jgi:hypothetical protein